MEYLALIVITLLLSAFFSGMEIAFITSNKLRIEIERKQGLLSARILSFFIRRPADYIATMLVGNNIVLVVYGIVIAMVLEAFFSLYFSSEVTIFLLQTIISTLLILLAADFIPKAIFRNNPNLYLNILSIPVMLSYVLLFPISWFSVKMANGLMFLLFRTNPTENQRLKVFGKVDLDHLVDEIVQQDDESIDTSDEIRIFQNALDFSALRLRDCMVPRTEIVAIEAGEGIPEITQKFIESGYSKVLVYKNNIDNIVGYIHSKDLFKRPASISEKLVPPVIVPETMPANKLLQRLMLERKSVAVVVDEFGGTAGMITIEDILEEIFGEIEDEHDTPGLVEKQVKENEYILSGRLEIEYLNEKYALEIPESDEYETLAGYLLYYHQNLPKVNEIIKTGRITFKILKMNNTRLDLVQLILHKAE
jgi:CBS domain containing-hemolysin-like protein